MLWCYKVYPYALLFELHKFVVFFRMTWKHASNREVWKSLVPYLLPPRNVHLVSVHRRQIVDLWITPTPAYRSDTGWAWIEAHGLKMLWGVLLVLICMLKLSDDVVPRAGLRNDLHPLLTTLKGTLKTEALLFIWHQLKCPQSGWAVKGDGFGMFQNFMNNKRCRFESTMSRWNFWRGSTKLIWDIDRYDVESDVPSQAGQWRTMISECSINSWTTKEGADFESIIYHWNFHTGITWNRSS